MERKIFIEDTKLSLVQYTRDDDIDFYNCGRDIDTQKGFNYKRSDKPEIQDISSQFPFTQNIEDYPFWAAIFSKENKKFIGVVRLSPPPYNDCDLAIWIYKPYRYMGFGTRAFYLGTKYCFENLGIEVVGAGCYENNTASQKMLKKIGFIRDKQNDSHETDAFTGEPIIQEAFIITKNNFHPIY